MAIVDDSTEMVNVPPLGRGSDSLESLERQFAVLEVFSSRRPALSLSEVARLTGVSKPAARRILLTLKVMGYVQLDGRLFSLTPKVLGLGWSYFSSLSLEEAVQPVLNDLRFSTDESCSVGELDGAEIVYIARAYTRRVTVVRGRVGARQPAYATSMGQVLLASLDEVELVELIGDRPLLQATAATVTDPALLQKRLAAVQTQGLALVDGELETGLRSIGVPILGPEDRVVAAVTVSTVAHLGSAEDLLKHLPALKHAAHLLSGAFTMS